MVLFATGVREGSSCQSHVTAVLFDMFVVSEA
uniref:Uncharacterized protein n=1 Tax=Anguilla anguilla TaxID=7936 RepID=A0A0E9V2G2_ANGAN